ncbi:MAG: methyltransferase domain-containing protein [Planctomycetes bacterium]|nr:methyltransferase domain-containing protein [Planctomycetota bacterium]
MTHELLAKTFDQWSADGRASAMELEHGDVARQVIAKLGIRAGEQILDLGCGNGWATRILAKMAAGVQATGVDVAPAMVAEAEKIHSLTIRARYHVGSFEQLDFPDARFHRVFSMEALYYAVDLERALSEIARVLRPGGSCEIVIDFYTDSVATSCWAKATGVPMHALSEAQWKARFERSGFVDVATTRVVDSRGPGEASRFTPSHCYPDFSTWVAVRSAGSLWIHASKPKNAS